MAEAAFQPTNEAVTDFLARLEPRKRADSLVLIQLMGGLTGKEPAMWHPGIIGFGKYRYKHASGREGDSPLAAFSPRKAEISIYLSADDSDERQELLSRLGKHRMGKGCLYVKRLEQVDMDALEQLIRRSIAGAAP